MISDKWNFTLKYILKTVEIYPIRAYNIRVGRATSGSIFHPISRVQENGGLQHVSLLHPRVRYRLA